MKPKAPGEIQIVIRINAKDKKALEAEAEAEMLSLSAYLRRLILMHPHRKGKK